MSFVDVYQGMPYHMHILRQVSTKNQTRRVRSDRVLNGDPISVDGAAQQPSPLIHAAAVGYRCSLYPRRESKIVQLGSVTPTCDRGSCLQHQRPCTFSILFPALNNEVAPRE